jgi:hypothetical protein
MSDTFTYKELKQLIEDAGYEYRSYSGRGMFGKSCIGFDPNGAKESTVAIEITNVVIEGIFMEYDGEDIEGLHSKVDEAMKKLDVLFKGMSKDSMGHDYIYYFQMVEWEEDTDG